MNNNKNDNYNINMKIKTNKAMLERSIKIVRKMKAIEISKGGKRYTYNQITNGGWLVDGYNPY